ncbi:MFS transporter [Nocardioides aromaticivorans]|uniref:MFS transporter n=1 Tax=Nocardioides aromaticivorans TaxID=200618 RepID=A0ABX7PNM2_9ACTN|nr:MFS transporter [Nocardioides aromaticivorans]QSR27403.1 MFS transporter [Nocardioides aromaticivorans]
MSDRSTPPTPMRRVAFASCAGTTIEFYDFFIYGTAAALVFPTVFFPALGDSAASVASFATFAVAFIARPVGAIGFGHFGDRLGRKKTLISTLLLMGAATVAIGLLPSADTIGVAAPILLVALRFLQGLAVGGEWAGATLLAAEYAPPNKRGLYAAFPQLGPAIAFALSSGTFLLINRAVGETSPAFVEWGWRVPFVASALLVLVGLYVRLKVEETPMFRETTKTRASTQGPLAAALKHQWREILLGGGSLAMLFAFFYIGTAFLTSYGTTVIGLSRATVLTMGVVGAVVFGALITLSAVYSDRFGRRKVVLASCLVAIPWGFALFPILDKGTGTAFAIGLFGTLAIFAVSYGPAGAMLPEMFRTEYRYTGAGMAYNLAGVIGGGTAPYLASDFVEAGNTNAVGWMLAAFGALSVVCVLLMAETRHRAMHAAPGAGTHVEEDVVPV